MLGASRGAVCFYLPQARQICMTVAQRNVCARSNHHLQCNELLWAQGRSDLAGAGRGRLADTDSLQHAVRVAAPCGGTHLDDFARAVEGIAVEGIATIVVHRGGRHTGNS